MEQKWMMVHPLGRYLLKMMRLVVILHILFLRGCLLPFGWSYGDVWIWWLVTR